MQLPGKFYITTPIYYVNARPHLGHAYTTIVCDAVARWHRMHGVDTYFLTGTDEHGVNVERSAAAAGTPPQRWVDGIAAEYRALWERMGITYDDFIRTTAPRHEAGVQEFFRQLQRNGYVYKDSYSGQYCVFDNLYVDVEAPGAPCPECGRPTETIHEDNYFFKLSAFEDRLLAHYKSHPEAIWPETRRNEVIAFIRGGLRDLSISRATLKWGIPVPGDPSQTIYVWLDALANYITALGYGSHTPEDQAKLNHYWPADAHVMSKEIVRFHCVYWPAFLMAAGLPAPRSVIVHGWLLFEESKMSKSRGNIVRAHTILEVLGSDALRYFLLREVVFGQDGSFSFDALVQRYNSDLANDLGNLASRTLTMMNRYFGGEVAKPESPGPAEEALTSLAGQTISEFEGLFASNQLSRALEAAWSLVRAVNKYLVETEPWTLGGREDSESRNRLGVILYTAAEALRIVCALAHPVIPVATSRIWQQLGAGDVSHARLDRLSWGELKAGAKLGAVEGVFPRADKSAIETMHQMEAEYHGSRLSESKAGREEKMAEEQEPPAGTHARAGQPATQAAAGPSEAAPAPPAAPVLPGQPVARSAAPSASPAAPSAQPSAGTPALPGPATTSSGEKITVDDFFKVDMRVALVKFAERVKGADKLLRLEVDLGTEVRQIVAGIARAYEPEKLIGRKIVIVANLQPRKLRGLESNGMLLAASFGEGQPVLASFLEDVPVGARLK
ncbi:MAG: methionine--tRNA ligase [Acidobacteria bacterium]|nr:methionine--tRNA ligase [Acidobacteriota bacterium]